MLGRPFYLFIFLGGGVLDVPLHFVQLHFRLPFAKLCCFLLYKKTVFLTCSGYVNDRKWCSVLQLNVFENVNHMRFVWRIHLAEQITCCMLDCKEVHNIFTLFYDPI